MSGRHGLASGGTMELIVVFEMEGGWTCLSEICSDEESSGTCLEVGLLNQAWYVFRGNLVLNLSTILANAVTSFRHMYLCLANSRNPTSWRKLSFG